MDPLSQTLADLRKELADTRGRLSRLERVRGTIAGGAVSMESLSDVNTSGITSGQALLWNGSAWLPGSYAALASPAFTGTPTVPTAATDTSTAQAASTAFVLGQLSAAGDGTPAMDGTAARGSGTHGARADHVHPTDTSRAPTASPTFTGTVDASTAADVKVPKPAAGDNDNSAPTTSWVQDLFGNPSTSRPVGRIQQTVAQSIPNSAWTAMTFNATALTDTDGMTLTASRLTCVTAGEYQINANATFAVSGTGERGIRVCHHDSGGNVLQYYGSQVLVAHAIGPNEYATSASVVMAAGDYIQAELYQSSGGALSTGVSVGVSTSSVPLLSAAWVGNTSSAWGNASGRMERTTAQSIPSAAFTAISYDTELQDTGTIVTIGSTPTRLTCDTPGTYLVEGNASVVANATGVRGLQIKHTLAAGGTKLYATVVESVPSGVNAAELATSKLIQMAVGDYVELLVYQNSGGALNTGTGGATASGSQTFGMTRVGYQSNPSNPPNARAYGSGATTVATSSFTAIALASESHDSATMHDLVTNNSRIVAPLSGLYRLKGQVAFVANATGYRIIALNKNAAGTYAAGSRVAAATSAVSSSTDVTVVEVDRDIRLTAGDYIEMFGWQNSGGNLATSTGEDVCFLEMRYVAA